MPVRDTKAGAGSGGRRLWKKSDKCVQAEMKNKMEASRLGLRSRILEKQKSYTSFSYDKEKRQVVTAMRHMRHNTTGVSGEGRPPTGLSDNVHEKSTYFQGGLSVSEKRFRKWRMTERQLERSMTCFGEEEIPRLPWDKNPLEDLDESFKQIVSLLGYNRSEVEELMRQRQIQKDKDKAEMEKGNKKKPFSPPPGHDTDVFECLRSDYEPEVRGPQIRRRGEVHDEEDRFSLPKWERSLVEGYTSRIKSKVRVRKGVKRPKSASALLSEFRKGTQSPVLAPSMHFGEGGGSALVEREEDEVSVVDQENRVPPVDATLQRPSLKHHASAPSDDRTFITHLNSHIKGKDHNGIVPPNSPQQRTRPHTAGPRFRGRGTTETRPSSTATSGRTAHVLSETSVKQAKTMENSPHKYKECTLTPGHGSQTSVKYSGNAGCNVNPDRSGSTTVCPVPSGHTKRLSWSKVKPVLTMTDERAASQAESRASSRMSVSQYEQAEIPVKSEDDVDSISTRETNNTHPRVQPDSTKKPGRVSFAQHVSKGRAKSFGGETGSNLRHHLDEVPEEEEGNDVIVTEAVTSESFRDERRNSSPPRLSRQREPPPDLSTGRESPTDDVFGEDPESEKLLLGRQMPQWKRDLMMEAPPGMLGSKVPLKVSLVMSKSQRRRELEKLIDEHVSDVRTLVTREHTRRMQARMHVFLTMLRVRDAVRERSGRDVTLEHDSPPV